MSVPKSNPNTILAIVLTAYFMIVLDLSIVYTGLPEIGVTMALDPVSLSWVQNAYLLCFGGFLLLSARLGDAFGRKRIFLVGIMLFTLSSVVIGLSQTAWELIAARAVQGIGASILAPTVLSIISATFAEGRERTRALSLYSMVAGFGASLGLVLGGIFAGLVSWRVGFLINLPVGIGLWFAVRRVLSETARTDARFDIPGAATSTIGSTALVYGIVNAAALGFGHPVTLTSFAVAILVLIGFIWIESRAAAPVLPLRLFASAERSVAYVARMLVVGSIVAFFFFATQLMQQVLGFSPLWAGIGFLPMTIPTFIAALAVPRLAARLGQAGVLVIAIGLLAIGLFLLAQAGPSANYWTAVSIPMLILGFGNGAILGPLTTFGLRAVEPRDQGAASGMVNVAHQIGGSLGLSVLVVVFAAAGSSDLVGTALLSHQINMALLGAAAMNLLAIILILVFIAPLQPEFSWLQGHRSRPA
ncbi:drug resistance transporter, EmrB/QacA subfamily [Devosia sp. YR412]|uniref:MFS transporter n=1 Tax=Devosia sp. YR412 TaxID=1881030 RepID=UPI0008C87D0B|nr:MFS transporter [Devosia sp. YR412]SEQ29875.1 drug resistance transporter, EmrB/QacA subfamily [Devosia sp. YR412]